MAGRAVGRRGHSTSAPSTDNTAPATSALASSMVGTWTGDLGAIIQAAGSAVRLPGGLTCTGSVTLTFKPDSTFAEAGDGRCSVSGHDIPAQWNAAGSYHAEAVP